MSFMEGRELRDKIKIDRRGLENIPSPRKELIRGYLEAAMRHFGKKLLSICLFGSVARGSATPESDIDLLVVAEDLPQDLGLRYHETNHIVLELRKSVAYNDMKIQGLSRTISEVFFTPEELKAHPPILLDIVLDGIILIDQDDLLASVLNDVRERLDALGSKRVPTTKGYYWILKPDIKPGEVVVI